MSNYYADKLNSQSLFQVYETDLPQVRQYLSSEIDFVKRGLSKSDRVLELGAGYGRIVKELAPFCYSIVGIDISKESAEFGAEYVKDYSNAHMVEMDVHQASFDEPFQVVLCLQNGLSAMGISHELIEKIFETVADGGRAYFSTYSENFWEWRIKWFEEQAAKGLLGELDYNQSKDGIIVCKDGFRATTQTVNDYKGIGEHCGHPYQIKEVDGSSLFLVIHKL